MRKITYSRRRNLNKKTFQENHNMIAGRLIIINATFRIRLKQNMLCGFDDNECSHYLITSSRHEAFVVNNQSRDFSCTHKDNVIVVESHHKQNNVPIKSNKAKKLTFNTTRRIWQKESNDELHTQNQSNIYIDHLSIYPSFKFY